MALDMDTGKILWSVQDTEQDACGFQDTAAGPIFQRERRRTARNRWGRISILGRR